MKKSLALVLVLLLLAVFPPGTSAAASDDDNPKVTVVVDGDAYTAHVGDIISYTYYLDLSGLELGKPNYFTEVEGEVAYQYSGLKLLTELEDDDGYYPPLPYLKSGSIVVTSFENEPFRYNAVNLSGYQYKREKVLLQLEFEVTGTEDLYITNTVKNLGSDGVKMVYLSKTLIQPKTETLVTVYSDNKPYSDIIGDVDMDGKVVIIDATELQLWLSNSKELSDQAILNGDINQDSGTDILDVTAIQRKIAGLSYQVY